MVSSNAETVDSYLAELAEDRFEAISAVRDTINKHLPKGFAETLDYGMISYVVPLETYPDTYNKKPLMYASLGSQKNHMAVYLTGVYGDEKMAEWFRAEYKVTGKKMDMGKSCVRFKKLDQLPLELIGEAIGKMSVDEFIAMDERARS